MTRAMRKVVRYISPTCPAQPCCSSLPNSHPMGTLDKTGSISGWKKPAVWRSSVCLCSPSLTPRQESIRYLRLSSVNPDIIFSARIAMTMSRNTMPM